MFNDEMNIYALYFLLLDVFHFNVGDNVKVFGLILILCFHVDNKDCGMSPHLLIYFKKTIVYNQY